MLAETAGGVAYLQPTVLTDGRTVIVEVYVPDAEMRRGVWPAWFVLGGLAVVLVAGSILVADRLGGKLVRATRELGRQAAERAVEEQRRLESESRAARADDPMHDDAEHQWSDRHSDELNDGFHDFCYAYHE